MSLDLFQAGFRLAVPLVFAALGGLLSERSGIANIAIEGLLLVAAFTSAVVSHYAFDAGLANPAIIGLLAGLTAAGFMGLVFAVLCIYAKADQIVIGIGFNLLVAGSIPVLTKAMFNVTGATPQLNEQAVFQSFVPFSISSLALVFIIHWGLLKTRWGLRLRAAGDSPFSLSSQGVSVNKVRLNAVVLGSILVGVGGVYLSLCQGDGYFRDMTAGRGFIALAAVIFGRWKPLGAFWACIFFGLADALQMLLQGKIIGGWEVPNQFIQILPYLATIFVLIFYSRRIAAPLAINKR